MLTASQCYKKYGAPTDEKFMVLWDVPKELEKKAWFDKNIKNLVVNAATSAMNGI